MLNGRRRGGRAGAVAVERRRDGEEAEGAPGEGPGGGILLGRVEAGGDGGDRQHGEARRRAKVVRREQQARHHRLVRVLSHITCCPTCIDHSTSIDLCGVSVASDSDVDCHYSGIEMIFRL